MILVLYVNQVFILLFQKSTKNAAGTYFMLFFGGPAFNLILLTFIVTIPLDRNNN